MPLILPKGLLGEEVLKNKQIFTMDKSRARGQDIRPIRVALVNLMPKKKETEMQFLQVLSNTALQIEIDLVRMASYKPKNTSMDYLNKFYKTFDEIKNDKYDAMIITGAPVENLDYGEIVYWRELEEILDYAKENVYSTMFICWAAQAGLYHYYGIDKTLREDKIFGLYSYFKDVDDRLLKGFDDEFSIPQSRYSYIPEESLENIEDLKILASREDTGVALAASRDYRFIFSFGHWEYDDKTLHREYVRDLEKGLDTAMPVNYYRGDDMTRGVRVNWRSAASLFFSNWLNYCVYQETPYDIEKIEKKKVAKFGGSSLSDASQFAKVKDIILSNEDRGVIVVSAPGRRYEGDEKVTDILINIDSLRQDMDRISELIRTLEAELSYKKDKFQSSLDRVRKRFTDLAKSLDLDDNLLLEIDRVCRQIEKADSKDFILSRGEYLNARLMASYLSYDFVDARELIFFDSQGDLDEKRTYKAIRDRLKGKDKLVVPGFYGSDSLDRIRVFERGGSDITGSLIASGLNSEIYENWTDVNGVMTGDPRVDKRAETIPILSYDDLLDISSKGAEVYQLDAIKPLVDRKIPLRILNTNDPSFKGTIINDKGEIDCEED